MHCQYRSVSVLLATLALASALGCATAPAADGAPAAAAAPSSVDGAAATTAEASGTAPAQLAAVALGQAIVPPPAPGERRGIRSLPGTRWVAAGEDAQFNELVFTEAFVTFGTREGGVVMVPADYSSVHPACLGYPSCVLTLDGANRPAPFFFGMQDGVLFAADCAFEGQPGPNEQPIQIASLREGLGATVLYETATTLCWNPGRVPYVPAPL